MEQHSNKWLQHFILLVGPLLTVIDIFIVNIAVPSIQQDLSATDAQMEMIIVFYLLGYASFQVLGSRSGDIYGRKKIFLWGMFFFVVTSCICGFANSATTIIIARFFQGISGAFMQSQALAYLQELFPETKERTKALGYLGITLGIASLIGQFLGGYLSELDTFISGWRFIFFINLPIGIAALIAAKKHLQNTKLNAEEKLDFSGVVLFTLALGSFIYPLTEGRELGYPLWSFVMLFSSLALFIYFIVDQKKKLKLGRYPLMDVRLFKIMDYNLGLVLVTFYFMMHTSYYLLSTIYLQNGLHLTPFQTGKYFVASGVLFMAASFLSVRLVNKYGKKPIQLSAVLMIFVYVLQLYYFNQQPSDLILLTIIPLQGFCGGLILPSLINLTLKNVPPQFVGIASGTYNTIQQVASSMGICFIAGLFFNIVQSTQDYVSAFHYSLYAGIACLIVTFIVLYFIQDIKRHKTSKDG
ncbi:major facilitator superfamily MFS_1 [Pseudopedobacter saltans DSM 12145]|uniref:Major facilitator superfamily MFS_1 n=1 Tax=Pseudopedobacter saltans (strain ATCC 51119 / DSM 12145 / JCM 21818 / CCUG 39354 / LMG 10337 / NBRC 100064 / NCIMB 13643) TaxID=762903 RepID=F0SEB7_PSESL|nr:MFS transporter [Pseudopedobacter saltans]ADY54039.1 major facilitator superfamily MFS_1 [Pseudopedobacter saltans DSM 12145]